MKKAVLFAALMGIASATSAGDFNFSLTGEPTVPAPTPQGYCWENRGGDQGCKFD